jgi:uncharacterized protein (TIGR03067 family)
MSLFVSVIAWFAMFISIAFQGVATDGGVANGDVAKFQGTWSVVSVECGGEKDDQDIDKYTFTFDGNTMIVRERGRDDAGDQDDEVVVKFELVRRGGRCAKQIRFGGACGIYDFKDGNLRICYSLDGDEPEMMRTATERPEDVLMVLRRVGLR